MTINQTGKRMLPLSDMDPSLRFGISENPITAMTAITRDHGDLL